MVSGADTADLRARMDPALFRPVLTNIIGNGIEANPGREVTFPIEVSATKSGIQWIFQTMGKRCRRRSRRAFSTPMYRGDKAGQHGFGARYRQEDRHGARGEIAYTEIDGHPRFSISLPRVD